MKISKSLVGQMKTDTRRQLNEQREQREFLGRIEKAVASAESVVDVVSAHNESEIDTAPGLDQVSYSRSAAYGDESNVWQPFNPFYGPEDYVETAQANLKEGERNVSVTGDLSHSQAVSVVDLPGGEKTEYRIYTREDGRLKITKGTDNDGQAEYDVYKGGFQIFLNDKFAW